VLLLFTVSGRSTHDVLTGDEIAGEILRGLVGGIGIAASVPITTAVAAAVVTVASLRRPPADGAGRRLGGIRTGPLGHAGTGVGHGR
jgi:hypothetical protein